MATQGRGTGVDLMEGETVLSSANPSPDAEIRRAFKGFHAPTDDQ